MISLYESKLESILPGYFKNEIYAQAFCHAVDKQVQKILDRCKKIGIWSNLAEADESILDYLSAELRTQYYTNDLEVEVKRNLIANTLVWYQKAGTIKAIEELITAIFGEGQVHEWHEYEGKPHHFKISTPNPNITGDTLEEFNNIISRIKRKTAILDVVEISLNATMNTYYGFTIHIGDFISLKQEG